MVIKFFASYLSRKILLSSCLFPRKHLLTLEILLDAASEFRVMCVIVILSSVYSHTSGVSKGMWNLNQSLKMLTANHRQK
jgi:hypothetical protein